MSPEIEEIELDILNARCRGLSSRKAVIQESLKVIHAAAALKEMGPFMCPSCLSEAIVRKCTEKVDHFAHKARLSPIVRAKDHELHETVSKELLEILTDIYPNGNWAKDRPIKKNEEKELKEIVPDLSGRDNDKKPIAIEIQRTPYTIPKIYSKTVEYQKRNIFVLWIVPLREDLGCDCFRPRLFEKYLHSMYYGRVYYYIPNRSKKIIPVHFSPAKRWIEETNWFDKDSKEERTEGGYYLTYRTIKSPNFGQELELSSNFKTKSNPGFSHKNVKKDVPQCFTLQDTLEKWWPTDEFKSLSKQRELIGNSKIFEDYDFVDEYDDEIE